MRGYDRGYDYGLRGWPQAQRRQEPVRMRFVGGYGGDYGGPERYATAYGRRGYRSEPLPNHVTAPYNLDYVRPGHRRDYPVNPVRYAGDRPGRMIDPYDYHAPYQTLGGTRTWRGEWPAGWERARPRYGSDYPRARHDRGL